MGGELPKESPPGSRNGNTVTPPLSAGRFVSHKVFITLFCKDEFPQKNVNFFFISVTIKDELTDLCGK